MPAALTRLPLLIAALCTLVDGSALVLYGWSAAGSSALLVLVLLADAALATPPRFSAWVAAGQAALVPVTVLVLPAANSFGQAGLLVAGYRAGAFLATGPASVALATVLAGDLAGWAVDPAMSWPGWVVPAAISFLSGGVLPWLVGRYTTAWRGHVDELRRREERRADDERAAVERAVAGERSALARDLHDVISHHVSGIAVHAGAARLGLPDGAARRSVEAVESAGRAAMADLRRLLDLLHGADPADRQPGVDDLDRLLGTMRAAGLPARLVTRGPSAPVPPSVDVAVYRVAQEALTNALRHGSPGPVEVVVDRGAAEIVLTVTNPMDGGGTPGAGRGLAGLRARVALFGGSIVAGPRPEGHRWELRAGLPVGDER